MLQPLEGEILAFPTISLHLFLSSVTLQSAPLSDFNHFVSLSTLSYYLFRGLPLALVYADFYSVSFLAFLKGIHSVHQCDPSIKFLELLINQTIPACPVNFCSSKFLAPPPYVQSRIYLGKIIHRRNYYLVLCERTN